MIRHHSYRRFNESYGDTLEDVQQLANDINRIVQSTGLPVNWDDLSKLAKAFKYRVEHAETDEEAVEWKREFRRSFNSYAENYISGFQHVMDQIDDIWED